MSFCSMLLGMLGQGAAPVSPGSPVSPLFIEHTDFQPVPRDRLDATADTVAEVISRESSSIVHVIDLGFTRNFDGSAVKKLNSTVQGSMEIGGLLYGVFQAWKDEKAVAIAPQHLWYTIVAQVAQVIKKTPKDYQSVFTNKSSGKQPIDTMVGAQDEVDPSALVSLLRSKLANPRLVDVITGPFPTPITGMIPLEEVMSTVLLEAASPFFSYFSSLCGLRAIELQGTLADWDVLTTKITALSKILGKLGSFSLNDQLLNRAREQAQTLRQVVAQGNTTNDELVETCFRAETNCGSGHVYMAYGWIFDFFTSNILEQCGSPVSFVSWRNTETGRMFYRAYGLTHGEYDTRGVLQMSFSRWTFEVLDKALFESISMTAGEFEPR
ncbi:hypothetical protein DIPPA_02483 [Diplonema papillatum]|nr:hypothetical protein DIPPA_02483 [Diplonema papillatum]|eukprot:gene22131-33954_t